MVAVPLSHITGTAALMLPFLLVGGHLVLIRAFDARAFVDLADVFGMTVAVLVPAMYVLLVHRGVLDGKNMPHWRVAGFGGAPMTCDPQGDWLAVSASEARERLWRNGNCRGGHHAESR